MYVLRASPSRRGGECEFQWIATERKSEGGGKRERERQGEKDFSLLSVDELIFDDFLTIWFFGFFGLLFSLSLYFSFFFFSNRNTPLCFSLGGNARIYEWLVSRIQKSGTIALHDPRSVCTACSRYNLGISTESQFRLPPSSSISVLFLFCFFFLAYFLSLSLSLFRLVRFGFTPLFIIVALLSSRDTLFLRAIAHARTAVRLRTVVNRIVGCFLYASYMPATNYHACVQSHTRERPRAAVDRNKIRNRNNGCVSWMCIYYFVTISQSCSIGVSRRRGVLLPTSGRVPLSKGPPFTRVRRPRAPVPPAIISIQK